VPPQHTLKYVPGVGQRLWEQIKEKRKKKRKEKKNRPPKEAWQN
jgi:predicted nucleic acid-binding OB-fold protein